MGHLSSHQYSDHLCGLISSWGSHTMSCFGTALLTGPQVGTHISLCYRKGGESPSHKVNLGPIREGSCGRGGLFFLFLPTAQTVLWCRLHDFLEDSPPEWSGQPHVAVASLMMRPPSVGPLRSSRPPSPGPSRSLKLHSREISSTKLLPEASLSGESRVRPLVFSTWLYWL